MTDTAGSDGGPAFPCEIGGDPKNDHHQTGNYTWQQYGMTLRDYFAAKALPELLRQYAATGGQFNVSERAYAIADAMLLARSA